MKRAAEVERKTKETDIILKLNIDGEGKYNIKTGLPFFDHMLELFTKHGFFDLDIKAKGDLEVGGHHLVEDVGIVLGEAFGKGLGDNKGIRRYGSFTLPMDNSIATVSIDISGRPALTFKARLGNDKIGDFDSELVEEFFKAFSNSARQTIHVGQDYGDNLHHRIEAIFKAFARALDNATQIDDRQSGVPSTKGVL